MTFNSEAHYRVHVLTHHPDALTDNPQCAQRRSRSSLVEETSGKQEVRYGFQDNSEIALFYELHDLTNWTFLYAEVINE